MASAIEVLVENASLDVPLGCYSFNSAQARRTIFSSNFHMNLHMAEAKNHTVHCKAKFKGHEHEATVKILIDSLHGWLSTEG